MKRREKKSIDPFIVSAEEHLLPGRLRQKLCGGAKCLQLKPHIIKEARNVCAVTCVRKAEYSVASIRCQFYVCVWLLQVLSLSWEALSWRLFSLHSSQSTETNVQQLCFEIQMLIKLMNWRNWAAKSEKVWSKTKLQTSVTKGQKFSFDATLC